MSEKIRALRVETDRGMAAQAGKTDAQILEEVEKEAKEEEAMKKAPAMAQRLICLNLRRLAPGMLPSSIGCAVFCDMRGGVASANEQYCDPCLARREEEAARERASLATVPAPFNNQPSAHKQPQLETSASYTSCRPIDCISSCHQQIKEWRGRFWEW